MTKKIGTALVDEISALFMDVFTREPWNDGWTSVGAAKEYVLDLIDNKNSLALGYFVDEKLCGLCLGYLFHWHSGKEYFVKEFCIAHDIQAKGHGRIFLGEIETILRSEGLRGVWLSTERRVPAYKFYISNGFRELEDCVFLAKNLSPKQ